MIDKVEAALRPPASAMVPYPAKVIDLSSGDRMVVHEVAREAVPCLLKAVRPLIDVSDDYYDIVAARTYAELLGWYRFRVKDEFCLVGTVNGELVGLVNSRKLTDQVGMSYHTLAFRRGDRIGAHLFAAKMEHHLDFLKQDEVWIVAESPNGLRRWMEEYELIFRPEQWHELGGGPTYVLTRELWERKKRAEKCQGSRPVPLELLQDARRMILPQTYAQIPSYKRAA
ncbi:MAG TPA: hypothetical protein VK473_18605 [Terriglobales bacterium]|nr:hypothetical protein [Terriglobales bacterium]